MIKFSPICMLEYAQAGVSSFPSLLFADNLKKIIWLGVFDSGFRNNKSPKANLSVKPFLLNTVLFVSVQFSSVTQLCLTLSFLYSYNLKQLKSKYLS